MSAKKKISKKSRRAAARRRRARIKLIFTLVLLLLVIIGAILLVTRFMKPAKDQAAPTAVPTAAPTQEVVATATALPTPTPTPEPTPTPSPAPTATPEPTATPKPAAEITITAVGDCTLGWYYTGNGRRSNFPKFVKNNTPDYFFENVQQYFQNDDISIINLEGPLTDRTKERPGRTFNFRGEPEYVEILKAGGVDICNLANNHALDFREGGFEDTCSTLAAAGIGASGYGPEYYTEINGYTVGSVGFTEWNFKDEDILETIRSAKQKCDLLIVSMHWGKEWQFEISDYAMRMGPQMIDAGADIVIGNHSHVYGSIYRYKGKYIIFSLGNFIFGGNDDPYKHECTVFRQKFIVSDGGAVDAGIDIIPARISSNEEKNDFKPRIMDPAEGAGQFQKVMDISNFVPGEVTWLEDSYVYQHGIVPKTSPTPEPTKEIVLPEITIEPTPVIAVG